MPLFDSLRGFIYGSSHDTADKSECVDDACYRLTDLTEKINADIGHMYTRISQEIGRLADDAVKAQAYAQREWRRGRQRERSEHDWIAGFFQGKRDQAEGREYISFIDAFASRPDVDVRADWAAGYYYGRMDEARKAFEDLLRETRENTFHLAERIAEKANEALRKDQNADLKLDELRAKAAFELDDTVSKIEATKESVIRMLDDKFKEASIRIRRIADSIGDSEKHAPTLRDLWQNGILDGFKMALMERVDSERMHAFQDSSQLKEGVRQIRNTANKAGEWVQDRIIPTGKEKLENAKHQAWKIKGKVEGQAEGMWDRAREQAGRAAGEATDRVRDSMASGASYIGERASGLGEDVSDRLYRGADYMRSNIENAADTAWSRARDKASDAGDTIVSGAEHLGQRMSGLKDDMSDQVRDKYHQAKEGLGNMAEEVRDRAYKKAGETGEAIASTGSRAGERIREGAGRMAEEARNKVYKKAGEAGEAIASMGSQAKEGLGDMAEGARNRVYKKAGETGEAIASIGSQAGERISEGAGRVASQAREQARYAMDTVSGTLEQAREKMTFNKPPEKINAQHILDKLKENIAAYSHHAKHQKDAGEFSLTNLLTGVHSDTASYFAQQLGTMLYDAKRSVEQLKQTADDFSEGMNKNVRIMAHNIQKQLTGKEDSISLLDAMKAAPNDRERVMIYIRGTLKQIENNARDAYNKAQRMRDETADTIREQANLLAEHTKQLNSKEIEAAEKQFKAVTRHMASMLEQAENYAREQYDTARKMREKAEVGMQGDLHEFVESMSNWLYTAQSTAAKQYDTVQDAGREIGNMLTDAVDTAKSKLVQVAQDAWDAARNKLGINEMEYTRLLQQYGLDSTSSVGDILASLMPDTQPIEDATETAVGRIRGWWRKLTGKSKGRQRASFSDKVKDEAQMAREQIYRIYEEALSMYNQAHDSFVPAMRDQAQDLLEQTKGQIKDTHAYSAMQDTFKDAQESTQATYNRLGGRVTHTFQALPLTFGYGVVLLLVACVLVFRMRRRQRMALQSIEYQEYTQVPRSSADMDTQDDNDDTARGKESSDADDTEHLLSATGNVAASGRHLRRLSRDSHAERTIGISDEKRRRSSGTFTLARLSYQCKLSASY
jgi:hypothetical protein